MSNDFNYVLWHSLAEDDYPPTGDDYLVAVEHDGRYTISICAYTSEYGWSVWDSFRDVRTERITHWAFLPMQPIE